MQRSRSQAAHSVSELLRRVTTLDANIQRTLNDWIKSAEFRAVDDLIGQIAFFRAAEHKITWATISVLFQAAESTLHDWLRRRQTEMPDEESAHLGDDVLGGPNSYLTQREEDVVLQWIWDAQCEKRCPTSPEVREFAESLRKQRTDDGRPCHRSWWHSFKGRHPELKAITASGTENARCEVAQKDVLAYFAEVKSVLAQIRTPAQLLNMDETGFCSRPEKARKRKVVYRVDCPVRPAFRELTDPNHITLVATITLSGESLKPMFLTTSPPGLTDPSMAELAPDMLVYRTGKAYQTHESMASYLRDVLGPYCQRVRDEMHDGTMPIFIIMDNCGCHKKETLSAAYASLNIKVIWLPPHSSHFLQPLDLVMFARLKMRYRERQAIKTRPKWVSKVLRIHQSWHECTHRLTIRAAWTAAAIIHTASESPEWRIDEISVARKLEEHCRARSLGLPNDPTGIRVPTIDDVLRWLAGVGPRPSQS
jgi:hypothetical protein